MDTTVTIPTGAMAERWKWSAFCVYALFMGAVAYPLYANWVWGGGWLSTLGKSFGLGHGHVDFAGSSVVHMTGGVMAFVGAKMLGPRAGKFGPRGEVYPIPGHNAALVVLGTFILAFGWFGFNAGSSLAGTDLRIAIIAVNTMLASASGAAAAYAATALKFGKPDLSMMCNGMLAGMVAITAPCAFVSAPASMLIGGVAGVLVIESALFIERRLRVDDPVGASSVHGVCGMWGVISLGLFANGSYGGGLNGVAGPVRGLLHGDPGQLAAAFVGIAANLLWVGSISAVTLLVLKATVGLRVSESDEVLGLDVPELGVPGYFGDAVSPLPEQVPTVQDLPVVAPPPVRSSATMTVPRTPPLPPAATVPRLRP
jgi:Amt family ammonium transporter